MLTLAGMVAASALGFGAPAMAEAAPVQERAAPRGSYSRSCGNAYVNRGRLYADCRDRNGRTRGTSIELNRCTNSDIANDNGLLICGRVRGSYEDRPGGGGGWGGGGGRAEITVYRDADYRGASTSFTGEIANLDRSGFNDQISSMRLRGEWEVCTDAYFRGTCRTFDADVRNLGVWGLNDRISSMRPVGRGGRDRDRW